ncbi:Ribonuclease II [uncultured delta proteobacterium]|uniref:Ribonuclease II n=1 Tax=uncultured delta proteobacterium TaxID=34034 RepID=A0A212JTC6_9DELT|nr:Ribonuclease II [uncultured delta proteobacterium]
MSDSRVAFPTPGCLVECMQGNKPVLYWVLESGNDTVRILALGGKESKLAVSRLLPWYGPVFPADKTREAIGKILEEHARRREDAANGINILEIWDLAQGEVPHASAFWLAELAWENPDIDQVAAMGHAALACKTHFKFSPPDFEIYDAATVEKKTAEQDAMREREALASIGGEFFRNLWAVTDRKRTPLTAEEFPAAEHTVVFERLLRDRLADPETQNDAETWKLLTKSLPDDPHLPLLLAVAWGLVPEHHNFWLDRAGYEPDEAWTVPLADEVATLRASVAAASDAEPETASGPGGAPFISIDPASTADFDDAFSLAKNEDGTFSLSLAFACPARFWPFGGALDKAVCRRASSLYLPESDLHMMPQELVIAFSLLENERRPVGLLEMTLSAGGELLSLAPRLAWVTVAANLTLPGCQAVMDGPNATVPVTARQITAAAPYAAMLGHGLELARILQERRVAAGAVITERPDPDVTLEHEDGKTTVSVCHAPSTPSAQMVVGEFMILANNAWASWAAERGIPLIFRTQDVTLPKEFSGIWTEPEDIARIVKHLPPSSLELDHRPHTGLGVAIYAPLTSSIRRYTDLVNTAQIATYLQTGAPRLDRQQLASLQPAMSSFAEMTGRIQRYRPRYWKLLFYKQMGDRMWWDAVVVEENDAFAVLWLPLTQIAVRARRKTMGEKVYPGERVKVRIGKVDPLRNEIRVMAVSEQ